MKNKQDLQVGDKFDVLKAVVKSYDKYSLHQYMEQTSATKYGQITEFSRVVTVRNHIFENGKVVAINAQFISGKLKTIKLTSLNDEIETIDQQPHQMMMVDKTDLVNMIIGCELSYSLMNHDSIKKLGDYRGGFNDEWRWNRSAISKQTVQQLIEVYKLCK